MIFSNFVAGLSAQFFLNDAFSVKELMNNYLLTLHIFIINLFPFVKNKTLPTFKKIVSPQQSDQMCCAHWQQGSTRWSGSTPVLELWGPWTQNLIDNIQPWRSEEAYNNEQDTTCRVIPIKKDKKKAVNTISPPQAPIFLSFLPCFSTYKPLSLKPCCSKKRKNFPSLAARIFSILLNYLSFPSKPP